MRFWAVVPKSTFDTLQNCRIEKAPTALIAYDQAFGRGRHPKGHPLYKYQLGIWMVKDLGTRVSVIQSNKQRVALLQDKAGWFDPFA